MLCYPHVMEIFVITAAGRYISTSVVVSGIAEHFLHHLHNTRPPDGHHGHNTWPKGKKIDQKPVI